MNPGNPINSEKKQPANNADSTSVQPSIDEADIAGSMKTEEPTGWDLAPQAIADPQQKRHPRPDGVGGLIAADEDASPLERHKQNNRPAK